MAGRDQAKADRFGFWNEPADTHDTPGPLSRALACGRRRCGAAGNRGQAPDMSIPLLGLKVGYILLVIRWGSHVKRSSSPWQGLRHRRRVDRCLSSFPDFAGGCAVLRRSMDLQIYSQWPQRTAAAAKESEFRYHAAPAFVDTPPRTSTDTPAPPTATKILEEPKPGSSKIFVAGDRVTGGCSS
jgi:hypothetical protein